MSIRMNYLPEQRKTDLHVSRTTRPVTQVALVAVNMASMTPSRPVLLEMGRVSSSVPTAMTSRKLLQMVCVALLPASQPLLGRRVRFLVYFSHCNLPGLPPASSQRGESFCRPCAKFPGAGASLYRIHLFSLRFNLICALFAVSYL